MRLALAPGLLLACGPAFAAGAGQGVPWWVWPLALFLVCFVMGVVAVPAGIGGGTLFVPIVGSFFPFHLDSRVRHEDSLDEEILADAREKTADLIVIRRRGRASFLSRLLIGGRVGRVIERAPCSVLMAPRAARPWTQRVLAAVDPGSLQAGVASAGAAIARESRLALQLLAVVPDEAAIPDAHLALAGVLQQARDSGVAADAAVRVGRAADEIIAGTREAGADLLVVGRSGRSGRRPGLGGTAREVVGPAEGPVLIHAGPEPDLAARP